LASEAEALHEKFLDEFNLHLLTPLKHYKELSEKLSANERIEAMLSFAFQSGAMMDYVRYEQFDPGEEFQNKIKSIQKKRFIFFMIKEEGEVKMINSVPNQNGILPLPSFFFFFPFLIEMAFCLPSRNCNFISMLMILFSSSISLSLVVIGRSLPSSKLKVF